MIPKEMIALMIDSGYEIYMDHISKRKRERRGENTHHVENKVVGVAGR